ncbi:MAG TPA: SAM-dependent methyltransferase [Candidatus Copromorpha excrementigallinarum]|uniref:SAM-dependent methyltransferase n=1 Tax=Candidatus Allocopromorpha excrementigallinarum TaxID=2840742 RepID=A0A9D1I451_9FIRM|nr:SAM-dependent methyltransferase [Candidatus Copromorpha excrementigallinarum]
MRPVIIKGEYMLQAEYQYEKKAIHKNLSLYEAVDFALEAVKNDFKQVNILTETGDIQILASDPQKPRIIRKDSGRLLQSARHDRKKRYIIEDGIPCDFLIKLGVMSPEGRVYKKRYSKFRQINRFLEIADSAFEYLPSSGDIDIIDFGCGKSYLTFAMYYYFRKIMGRSVRITGLDLKEDVIDFCSRTALELGYDGLSFRKGDIADYRSGGAHMVVTLHACDTATDYALINAVKWKSRVILSVPCCQHELFSQIDSPVNRPMLKHGIIRDKFTELLTDALRGLKLEAAGYRVQMTEFTSLEHTSKNIMIKALLPDSPDRKAAARAEDEYRRLRDFYSVSPAIEALPSLSDN